MSLRQIATLKRLDFIKDKYINFKIINFGIFLSFSLI